MLLKDFRHSNVYIVHGASSVATTSTTMASLPNWVATDMDSPGLLWHASFSRRSSSASMDPSARARTELDYHAVGSLVASAAPARAIRGVPSLTAIVEVLKMITLERFRLI